MRNPAHRRFLVVAVLLLASCGKQPDPTPTETETSPATCPPDSVVTWDSFAKGFIDSWCTGCHSSALQGEARNGAPDGVDFDTYQQTVSFAASIQALATGEFATMPPTGGVTEADRALLLEWLTCELPGTPTEAGPCDSLTWAEGDQILTSQADADALCTSHNAVRGSVDVVGDGVSIECLCEVEGGVNLLGDQPNLPLLTTVGGPLVIGGNAQTVEVANLRVSGPFSLVASQTVDISLPELDSVSGSVDVVDNPTLERASLPRLRTVDSNLTVTGNEALIDLDIVRLDTVSGSVTLTDNAALADLQSTEAIEFIGGDVLIARNASLVDANLFFSLQSVGRVEVSDNPLLYFLEGFTLTTEMAEFVVQDNPALERVQVLNNLVTTDGDLRFERNTALNMMGGLENLTHVGGQIRLEGAAAVDELTAFDTVQSAGGVHIIDNGGTTGVLSFGALVDVLGDLEFTGNPSIMGAGLMESVQTVTGSLVIHDNDNFGRVTPLLTIQSVGADLIITDNIRLATADAEALRDAIGLSNIGGTVTISGNEP